MSYPMNIGEAAQAAGLTAKMIRHYEGLAMIPQPSRTDAGYRQYSRRDVEMFRFIRLARSMGFSIKQVERLLSLWADTSRESREVKALAHEHLAELDRKMAELASMKASLERIAADCPGDERGDCPILSDLSGDAPAPTLRSRPTQRVERVRAASRSVADRPEAASYAGLVAWSQGLHRDVAVLRAY